MSRTRAPLGAACRPPVPAAALPAAAGAQVSVLSETVQEQAAAPGETYTGTVRVLNPSRVPQSVRVYQADYRFYADGTTHFDPAGSTARSNARWVAPGAGQVPLPPGGETTVTYTVTVPAGDSVTGTYWSAVMVEGVPLGGGAPGGPDGRAQVGVGAVLRYAVQVATHVRGGSRRVRFTVPAVRAAPDGGRTLDLTVENVGERGYRPSLWVEVYDAEGALRARRQQDRGLLYPGTSVRQQFALGALPAGTYKVVLFADTGDDAVYAAAHKLAF